MRDVVVTPVHSGPPRRSRNLEERIWLRFPAAYRRLALILSRLSPRSRLRRVLLRRGLVSGWAAFNRRDFEFRRVMFAPDVESEFAHDQQALGLSGLRGHAAMDQALSELTEVWDFELEPAYSSILATACSSLASLAGMHAQAEYRSSRSTRNW